MHINKAKFINYYHIKKFLLDSDILTKLENKLGRQGDGNTKASFGTRKVLGKEKKILSKIIFSYLISP